MNKIYWDKKTVGCNIGGRIYMHPEIVNYPKLFEAVLEHEKGHTHDFDKTDFLHDLFNEELKGVKWEYWKFVFTHPTTWLGFLPISRIGGKWTIDVVMTIMWLFAILVMIIALNTPL